MCPWHLASSVSGIVRFRSLPLCRLEPRFASTVEPLWVGKMTPLLGDILFWGDASDLGGEAEAERGLFFGLRTSSGAFLDVRIARWSWSSPTSGLPCLSRPVKGNNGLRGAGEVLCPRLGGLR